MCKVSIIIPNYNHASFLKQRIDSVLNQTYQNFELIILDDCSTDNSMDVIDQYKYNGKISYVVYNEINSGSTFRQWDKGINLAQGEFIWIAESDDIAEDSFLERLVPLLANSQDIGIAYCQSNKLNDKNEVTGTWFDWTADFESNIFSDAFGMDGKQFIKSFLIYKNTIPNASAAIFRKSLYTHVGGVKENTKTNNDWLLWLKILSVSRVSFIADPLNYFRYHDKSVIAEARMSNTTFIGYYDRILRFSFQEYLQSFLESGSEEIYNEISLKNKYLIADNYMGEAFFQFSNRHKLKSLLFLFKATFYGGVHFNYIRIALGKGFKKLFVIRK